MTAQKTMLRKYILFILLCGFSVASLSAQKADYSHKVITFDGKEYEGDIIHFQPGDLLHLRLASGEEIFLAADAIKRIVYTAPINPKAIGSRMPAKGAKNRSETSVREKDWLIQIGSGLLFGSATFGNFGLRENIFGYTVSMALSRQIYPNLQLGAGLDYTAFNPGNQENALSLFARLRGLSSQQPRAFFLQLEGGYGLPIIGASDVLIEKEGGLLLHPSIGYVFRLTDKTPELSIDFGYRFTEQSRTFNNFNTTRTQNNTYRRATLRTTIAF